MQSYWNGLYEELLESGPAKRKKPFEGIWIYQLFIYLFLVSLISVPVNLAGQGWLRD